MNDNSRTESDAAHFAAIAGASEHDADAIQPPVLTRYCSVCQRGTKGYVCGPCARDAAEAQEERIVREERDREWWTA